MAYFTTHPGLEVSPDEGKMTVGVGCISERGDCIVMGSDMRATYGKKMPNERDYVSVGPNDQCGKVFRLASFTLMGCIAGRISECHAIIANTVFNLRKLARLKNFSREHVAVAIDAARIREMRRIYTWAMEKNWGISLNEYARGKVPGGKLDPLLIRAGHNLLKDTPLRVQLIVGGFVKGNAVFLRALQKEALEEESSPGVYIIGAGSVYAMRRLNRRGQNYMMSLPRTLLHVHEAMIAARADKTVGPATGYIVMRKHVSDVVYMPANSPTLEKWRKAYRNRATTASLDDSKVAGMEIRQQLVYPPRITANG